MAKTTQTPTAFNMFNGDAASGEAVRENMERFMSFAGEFSELSREGMTACTEAVRVTAKGAQEANTQTMSYLQNAMAASVEATKSVASAKSVQEAVELQATFAKSAFDAYMKQFSSMANLMASTMREATGPLNAHAGQMVEKFQNVK